MPLFFHQSILATAFSSAAGLLLLTGTGLAQSETFATNSYLGTAGQSAHYHLPTFNTDLGTLESVAITLQFNLCPVITVDNSTDAPIGFTDAILSLPITADLPGNLDSTTTISGGVNSGTAQPGSTTYALLRSPNFVSESVAPADFADWEGLPNQKLTLVLTPGASTTVGTGSAPGVTFTGKSMEWAQLTVTYTYLSSDAAPEPPGRILSFLVGAVMLVGIGNRVVRARAA